MSRLSVYFIISCTAIRRQEANEFLKRSKRDNHALEEMGPGDFERECIEETCNAEEFNEIFEDLNIYSQEKLRGDYDKCINETKIASEKFELEDAKGQNTNPKYQALRSHEEKHHRRICSSKLIFEQTASTYLKFANDLRIDKSYM